MSTEYAKELPFEKQSTGVPEIVSETLVIVVSQIGILNAAEKDMDSLKPITCVNSDSRNG